MSEIMENPKGGCALAGINSVLGALDRVCPIFHSGPGCCMQSSASEQGQSGHKSSCFVSSVSIPSSNMLEKEVVFGGINKLRTTIQGAVDIIDADAYFVLTGCTAGIIGDDIASVTNEFLEKGIPDAGKWASSHFRKGVEPPFSFELDGIPSDRFIKKWKFSSTKAPDGTLECVWQDPATALKAICKVRVHADFDEVEWTLAFRNEGKADSPRISEVKAASVQIVPRKGSQGFILNHINGSVGASDDFAPHYTPVTSEAISFRPLEGRSSSGGPAPFFNIISSGSEDSGLVLSIGWSGQWIASFRTDPSSGKLAAEAGMAVFDAFLHPGEEVRMPSISLMAWKGGSGEVNMTGNNKFRRFVLEHHSRKIDGKTAMYPLCGGFNWGEPAPLSEYSAMTTDYARFLIDRYADFDIVPDAMWLDAGWYKSLRGFSRIPTSTTSTGSGFSPFRASSTPSFSTSPTPRP